MTVGQRTPAIEVEIATGLPAGGVSGDGELVDPGGVLAFADGLVFAVVPLEGVGTGGDVDGALLPVDVAGDAGEGLDAVELDGEEVEGGLGVDFPPERHGGGALYAGDLEGAALVVGDRAAAGCVVAVVGDGGLRGPWCVA